MTIQLPDDLDQKVYAAVGAAYRMWKDRSASDPLHVPRPFLVVGPCSVTVNALWGGSTLVVMVATNVPGLDLGALPYEHNVGQTPVRQTKSEVVFVFQR